MKSVLLSIKPGWCNLIFLGEKTVEVRKTKPMIQPPFKCYVYCTKKTGGWFREHNDGYFEQLDGRIIGEFLCDEIYEISPKDGFDKIQEFPPVRCPPDDIELQTSMSWEHITSYLHGKGWAWHISNPKMYEHPKFLFEITPYCVLMGNHKCCAPNKVRCDNQIHLFDDSTGEKCKCMKNLKCPPQSWCYVQEF